MANINKIKLSGQTYNIQDLNATKTVELTQAEYDALPATAKTSNSLFVITDAKGADLSNYYTKSETDNLLDTKLDVTAYTPTDLSNYYTKSETSGATEISTALASKADTATTYTKTETDNAITAATSTKQDTLVSGTNIKTINNESILGSGNITIEGGSGGGKAISAGTNISITTGETADTINCTIPVSADTNNSFGIKTNYFGNTAGHLSFAGGYITKAKMDCSFAFGMGAETNYYYSTAIGQYTKTTCWGETAFGSYNKSVSASTSFDGNSGNTLFSVGNGSDKNNARHNAFEIRQNGDIYIADTNDTSTTNYYEKPMIKLQDALGGGGGGSSYTAGDGIDITNDVISVTGKVDTSAFTAHTADTVIHVTSDEKAAWNAKSDFSGDYNDLANKPTIPTVPTSNTAFTNDAGYITSDAISGKVDTSTYNTYTAATDTALASKQTTLTAGTGISIVDNVISATSGGGGGGKAVSAGTNISITTGETADTINCTLPIETIKNAYGISQIYVGDNIYKNNNYEAIVIASKDDSSTGKTSVEFAHGAISIGSSNKVFQNGIVIGSDSTAGASNSWNNIAIGHNTVASGTTKTNINNQIKVDASNQVYIYNKDNTEMICLQDALGGGGGTVDTEITSASTNPVTSAAIYNQFGGLKLVKLTKSEYDSLTTKDNSTLYVIVN